MRRRRCLGLCLGTLFGPLPLPLPLPLERLDVSIGSSVRSFFELAGGLTVVTRAAAHHTISDNTVAQSTSLLQFIWIWRSRRTRTACFQRLASPMQIVVRRSPELPRDLLNDNPNVIANSSVLHDKGAGQSARVRTTARTKLMLHADKMNARPSLDP